MLEKIKNKLSRHVDLLRDDVKNYFFNKRWFNTAQGKANKKLIAALHHKHSGKRCFVMANGPSLVKCDLKLLKNEVTIASNAQFLLWDELGYKPTYLTIEDAMVAKGRCKTYSSLKDTTKIFPKDLSDVLKPDEYTIYINFIRKYKDFPVFSEDFLYGVYWGGTVSYLNMQLAYYLGCSEIYLIGFDHSFNVPKLVNNMATTDGPDDNHFHPDYYLKGHKWYDPNIERMNLAYGKAKQFIESRGVKIYNATVGGKLEIFERVDYNSLFPDN